MAQGLFKPLARILWHGVHMPDPGKVAARCQELHVDTIAWFWNQGPQFGAQYSTYARPSDAVVKSTIGALNAAGIRVVVCSWIHRTPAYIQAMTDGFNLGMDAGAVLCQIDAEENWSSGINAADAATYTRDILVPAFAGLPMTITGYGYAPDDVQALTKGLGAGYVPQAYATRVKGKKFTYGKEYHPDVLVPASIKSAEKNGLRLAGVGLPVYGTPHDGWTAERQLQTSLSIVQDAGLPVWLWVYASVYGSGASPAAWRKVLQEVKPGEVVEIVKDEDGNTWAVIKKAAVGLGVAGAITGTILVGREAWKAYKKKGRRR